MFLSLIQQRRSIRKYMKKSVEPEKIDLIMEAALRAPSSRGIYPWEYIVIDRPDLLEKLAKSKQYGSSFLKDAPLAIVICANPQKCDVWIEDTSIAPTYIQLAAESLGLGSCWIQVRERMHDSVKTAGEYIKETLEIPGDLVVASIIACGYPDEKLDPHPKESLKYEKISRNGYRRQNL